MSMWNAWPCTIVLKFRGIKMLSVKVAIQLHLFPWWPHYEKRVYSRNSCQGFVFTGLVEQVFSYKYTWLSKIWQLYPCISFGERQLNILLKLAILCYQLFTLVKLLLRRLQLWNSWVLWSSFSHWLKWYIQANTVVWVKSIFVELFEFSFDAKKEALQPVTGHPCQFQRQRLVFFLFSLPFNFLWPFFPGLLLCVFRLSCFMAFEFVWLSCALRAKPIFMGKSTGSSPLHGSDS